MNLPRYHITYRSESGYVRARRCSADGPYEALWRIATMGAEQTDGSKLISITEVSAPKHDLQGYRHPERGDELA